MKICHIVNGSNYSIMETYIRFINEYFEVSDHQFVINDLEENIPPAIMEYQNVYAHESLGRVNRFRMIANFFKTNEMIILHSLSLPLELQTFLLIKPKLLKKVVWVSWGMDLYQWKKRGLNPVNIIKNHISYLIRVKVKRFVGIFPPDIDSFRTQFNTEAKTFYASYVDSLYNPIFDIKQDKSVLMSDKYSSIKIMIGHQCNSTLNHFEVIDALSKFKDENIELIIPLSYGDMKYGDQVEMYASSIFESKVKCLRDKIPKNEYMDLLNSIDIAIFNTRRQIGLGNIYPLLYLGKKIIMPSDSVMYRYFAREGVEIYDFYETLNQNFENLVKETNICGAREFINSKILNKDLYYKMWNEVFDSTMY